MKRTYLLVGLFLLISSFYAGLIYFTLRPPILPSQTVPFCTYSNHMRDDLKWVILHAIKQAKQTIWMQIYALTDPDVLAALKEKEAAGINVTLFYDQNASMALNRRFLHAFPVQCTGLMHRKILIIDQACIFIGTANFTSSSLSFHHNVMIGCFHPELANIIELGHELEATALLNNNTLKYYFLPDFEKKALNQLKLLIGQAKKEIVIAMFTLTHPEILEELIAAQKRGVAVTVIIDGYSAKGASKDALATLIKHQIKVHTSQGKELLHYKLAVFDHEWIVMGSANWTKHAFSNNQDCMIVLHLTSPKDQKWWRQLLKAAEAEARCVDSSDLIYEEAI
jgi:cardiolipin synthase